MRVGVLADIHGNLPALDAVLEDVRQQGADAVVVLGDLADRGPYPTQVLERVQQAARAVILGNTDAMLLRLARGDAPVAWFEHAQFAPLRWTYERLVSGIRSVTNRSIRSDADSGGTSSRTTKTDESLIGRPVAR